MASRKSNHKGKQVDWKATVEMLSSASSSVVSAEERPADCNSAGPSGANCTTGPNDLENQDDLLAPMRHEPTKAFETIKLIYDLREIDSTRNRRARVPVKRSAPPPPVGVISPMKRPANRFLDNKYDVTDRAEDVMSAESKEPDEYAKGMEMNTQRAVCETHTADSASSRAQASTFPPRNLGLDHWECHECSLIHPIQSDGGRWDRRDPNVCKCCNHDRCGGCWDLDEGGWRVKQCDGRPLEKDKLGCV